MLPCAGRRRYFSTNENTHAHTISTDRMPTRWRDTEKHMRTRSVSGFIFFSSFFAVAISSSYRSLLGAHKLFSEFRSNTNTIRQANRNRARIQIHTHTQRALLLRLQINRHISRLILFSGRTVPYVFRKFDSQTEIARTRANETKRSASLSWRPRLDEENGRSSSGAKKLKENSRCISMCVGLWDCGVGAYDVLICVHCIVSPKQTKGKY